RSRRGGAPCAPPRRLFDVGAHIPAPIGAPRARIALTGAATGDPSRPEGGKKGPGTRKGAAKGLNAVLALSKRPHFATLSNQCGGGVDPPPATRRYTSSEPPRRYAGPTAPSRPHRRLDMKDTAAPPAGQAGLPLPLGVASSRWKNGLGPSPPPRPCSRRRCRSEP